MEDILKETGALLEGHFLLTSGKHSKKYVQCAKILSHPDKAAKVLKSVAEKVKELNPDILVGPAMGGVIVSYEIGRQIGKTAIFTERVNGKMELRRGFTINAGDRIVICEDVVTTAKSSMEVKELLESMGGKVICIASIIDRTSSDIPLPLISAIKLDIKTYDPKDCPLCKEKIPYEKPGSRNIK